MPKAKEEKQKFGIVPPKQILWVDGKKYRGGDRYPLPKEEVKRPSSTGGGNDGTGRSSQ